jgi:LacI family repressor for deo operon, udp, cdd, tsx, nupC, and nupG
MKDVAQKAQVSTATVSRALMNPDKVSQATRNRVEQAALEVGYFRRRWDVTSNAMSRAPSW